MNLKKYSYLVIVFAVVMGFSLSAGLAAAADKRMNDIRRPNMARGAGIMPNGVVGTVTSINGNTLIVSGHQRMASTTEAIFTVDTTNAKFVINNASSTLSAVSVGDTIIVQGTINGTNVVANVIRDGKFPTKMAEKAEKREQRAEEKNVKTRPIKQNPTISGNGQPVVAGTVTAVSGNSISLTNKSNVNYTVDITNAKLFQGKKSIVTSEIKVGDNVVVQGTINGSTIVASNVIDHQFKPANANKSKGGFMGGMGNFFSRIFGF